MAGDDNKVSTLVVLGLGLSLIYYLFKKWFKASESEDRSWHENAHIILNRADCRAVVKKLKSCCRNIQLLGLDCQWEKANGCRKTISTLMLSTYTGTVAIFRLDRFDAIPYLKVIYKFIADASDD
ncbi:hypothetical protein HA402_009094 [Bradysia odoriphaga]|nr:hypothetical protein HA402_009094 [Bradysia odoriphaga]